MIETAILSFLCGIVGGGISYIALNFAELKLTKGKNIKINKTTTLSITDAFYKPNTKFVRLTSKDKKTSSLDVEINISGVKSIFYNEY